MKTARCLRQFPILLGACLACVNPSSGAQSPDQSLQQLYHTAWTFRDGAPISWDLTQTADGYLWLGGRSGLYRFDGVRFERFTPVAGPPLPNTNIQSLDITNDGSLWIGWNVKGLSQLKDGRLVNYGEESGLSSGTVNGVQQDGRGRIWAFSPEGMYRLENNRWLPLGSGMGYSGATYPYGFTDRNGTMWVGAGRRDVYALSKSDTSFRLVLSGKEIVSITQDARDIVWGLDSKGTMIVLGSPDGKHQSRPLGLPGQMLKALFDRRGDLWIATTTMGIVRIRDFDRYGIGLPSEKVESLSLPNGGLSGETVYQIFEDHEGNIWTATSRGLDRLRNSAFSLLPIEKVHSKSALLEADKGNVYIAHPVGALSREPEALPATPIIPTDLNLAYRSPNGRTWFVGRHFLWQQTAHGFSKYPLPTLPEPNLPVESVTSDGGNGLWVTFPIRNGFFHFHDGLWTTFDINPALPTRSARAAMTDEQGRIWFGYSSSRVAILEKSGHVSLMTQDDDEKIGNVLSFHCRGNHIWIGGENGLRRFVDGHFQEIEDAQGNQFLGLSGISETSNGDLWLNGAFNIVMIPASELNRPSSSKSIMVKARVYDVLDGITAGSSGEDVNPTIAQGDNGKMWFALQNAVGMIDPAHSPQNKVAPPVAIQSLTSDSVVYSDLRALKLTPDPDSVRIDYTALSLTVPERVQFRYRLDGFDKDWQNAGTRRQAFYTKLGPGSYHFHVIAANNDGLWNEAGTTFSFIVPPTTVESLWFRILCFLAVACGITLVVAWRFRTMTARMKAHLSERMVERERIARELHDTLLQGFQGLVLKFQNVATQIPQLEPAHTMMNSALDQADEVIKEGRNKVRNLRAEGSDVTDLADALRLIGEELQSTYHVKFLLILRGDPLDLHPIVKDETYSIGREALTNAFVHAHATTVECEVTFQRRFFALGIRDDGSGIDRQVIEFGRAGHWGLGGMRERALKIRAKFGILSRTDEGTEITLRVPADLAYVDKPTGGYLSFFWRRVRSRGPLDAS